MMRVAYVSADPGVPVFGAKGCSVHVQEVIRAFLRRGARVHLLTSRPGGSPVADLERTTMHRLPTPTGSPAEREVGAQRLNSLITEALRSEGPFDLVYERYSLWSHAAMDWAHEAGIPGVLEVNAPLVEEQSLHRGLVDRAAAEQVAARVFSRASLLVAVSQGVRDYLLAQGVPAERIAVVPNGVNPERFPPVPRGTGTEGARFTVGFLGTLKPWHGLSVLLDAFDRLARQHPGCRLLLVGDGPERERLEAAAVDRGLEHRVVFPGQVPPDQVALYLGMMDCAVAPYENLPGFYFSPLKVYEYMAAGLPVVASRVGELAWLIEPGVDGLLVPPGDAGALAEALDCLRLDHPFCRELGAAARAKVLRDHTWDARVQAIVSRATGTALEVA